MISTQTQEPQSSTPTSHISPSDNGLPDVLAGPILRRLSSERLCLWLVTSQRMEMSLEIGPQGDAMQQLALGEDHCRVLPLGRHAYLSLIEVELEDPLPQDRYIEYDLRLRSLEGGDRGRGDRGGIADWAPHLCYPGQPRPAFVITAQQRRLLHGSCRKPHYQGPDGLAHVDGWLERHLDTPDARPRWLLLTGDQVYADDVAGPMLAAIHALIRRLGLFDEELDGATIANSQELYADQQSYYRRQQLLPDAEGVRKSFFSGVRKPVFTSDHAGNHLITFAEVIAMYLLVWSPTPWRLVDIKRPALDGDHRDTFERERKIIDSFAASLPQVARVMAQLPSLMIFDDHDITDDWNLTADWEATAYGHPFSKRIIGNALLGYLLCQGWGNAPDKLADPLAEVAHLLNDAKDGSDGTSLSDSTHSGSEGGSAHTSEHAAGWLNAAMQDTVIQHLLKFEGWEYEVSGTPKLVVLDTRTRRWRSERNPKRPSGLLDWEALSDFQQQLLDSPSVVIVSPAPMFGVKLIEVIQSLFTFAGKPLMVDAENWMAHRGAASVMLNIFRHSRTPGHYVVLSGDVHYSFVYDIRIRHRHGGPRLWQVTSSGLKNSFPDTLLDVLDRLNRWLFSPRSPMNWFTKRRPMAIRPRDPDRAKAGERLWNGPGIGLIELAEDGSPAEIRQLDARGFEVIFPQPHQHD